MRYQLKKPTTCEELSKELGVKVNELTTSPDGIVELDIDGKLTSTQKAKLKALLGLEVKELIGGV